MTDTSPRLGLPYCKVVEGGYVPTVAAVFEELNMATWKRLTDIEKSRIEIDLDTIAFMYSNGSGTEIHINSGQTLTVRESPEVVVTRS